MGKFTCILCYTFNRFFMCQSRADLLLLLLHRLLRYRSATIVTDTSTPKATSTARRRRPPDSVDSIPIHPFSAATGGSLEQTIFAALGRDGRSDAAVVVRAVFDRRLGIPGLMSGTGR